MGSVPSVSGPGGGRPHVRRDMDYVDSDRGRRPEQSQSEDTDTRVEEDIEEEKIDRREDNLSVPEFYVGHNNPKLNHRPILNPYPG